MLTRLQVPSLVPPPLPVRISPGCVVLGLRGPQDSCSPTFSYTSNSITCGCSAPLKLFCKPPTVSFSSQFNQQAVKLLVKKSGELLMAHDSSLMTGII